MGSKVGVLKIAAKRIGISFQEYQDILDMGLKWCHLGNHFVPRSEFGKNKLLGDGLAAFCRECNHVKVRKSTKGRISPLRGISPRLETRLKMSESHRGSKNHRWKGGISPINTNRLRKLASRKVGHEVEAGRLPKPDTMKCYLCGNPARDYHHYLGYEPEHWLDVKPVCRSCNINLIHEPKELVCPICKIPFKTTKNHQKYCSDKCLREANRIREKIRSPKRWQAYKAKRMHVRQILDSSFS